MNSYETLLKDAQNAQRYAQLTGWLTNKQKWAYTGAAAAGFAAGLDASIEQWGFAAFFLFISGAMTTCGALQGSRIPERATAILQDEINMSGLEAKV